MRKRITTISNALTLMRAALVALIFFSIVRLKFVLAILFFIIAVLTDILDGYIARKRRETTMFGKIFDPIADKALIGFTALALAFVLFGLPISIMVALIGLGMFLLIGYLLFHKRFPAFRPSAVGKILFSLQIVLLLVLLTTKNLFFLIAIAFLFPMSCIFYLFEYFSKNRKRKKRLSKDRNIFKSFRQD